MCLYSPRSQFISLTGLFSTAGGSARPGARPAGDARIGRATRLLGWLATIAVAWTICVVAAIADPAWDADVAPATTTRPAEFGAAPRGPAPPAAAAPPLWRDAALVPLPAIDPTSGPPATRTALQELLPPAARPAAGPEAGTGAGGDVFDAARPLSALRVSLDPPPGELPIDFARQRIGLEPLIVGGSEEDRRRLQMVYAWEASALSFGPIYIDNPNLERYGYSHGALEAGFSAFHFFSHVVALPYLVATYPPTQEIYTLGYYRPGSYAPYRRSRPPFTWRGALAEGALVCTLLLGIPGLP